MLVYYLLIFILIHQSNSQSLIFEEDNTHVTTCIRNVILHWNNNGISQITHVDINYPNNDIIKTINEMNMVTIVSKSATGRVNDQHNIEAYIVTMENFNALKNEFMYLTYDRSWKPNAQFLIVFRQQELDKLSEVFNILLHLHVFDVILIYATKESPIYTYNPFENKNCGKTYDEILRYDNCSHISVTELVLCKPVKKIKGCNFNVSLPHWPPFTIIPENNTKRVKHKGTEQYLMQILSEKLDFNITYKHYYNSEDFSTFDENMTATGSLGLLQKGHVDIVLGGMLLTFDRADGFGYINGYYDFKDEVTILVKKAGPVPTWKMIYIEFDNLVWFLIIVTFVTCFVVLSILFDLKDKCNLILVMLDILLSHGHKLRLKFKYQCIMLQWVIIAFLINTFYQTHLSGLTTHVSRNYQISNSKDIFNYKIQPCLSPLINVYTKAITGQQATNETNKDCNNLRNSVKIVGEDYTKYTVVFKSKISYYRYNISFDEFGNSNLYIFSTPIGKIIYAIYFYKGFPELEKMYNTALRLRENGLLDKHERDINYELKKQFHALKKRFGPRFILPWQILIIGVGLSTITFFGELLTDYIQRKRRPAIIFLH